VSTLSLRPEQQSYQKQEIELLASLNHVNHHTRQHQTITNNIQPNIVHVDKIFYSSTTVLVMELPNHLQSNNLQICFPRALCRRRSTFFLGAQESSDTSTRSSHHYVSSSESSCTHPQSWRCSSRLETRKCIADIFCCWSQGRHFGFWLCCKIETQAEIGKNDDRHWYISVYGAVGHIVC
jgi:hypothetical protein